MRCRRRCEFYPGLYRDVQTYLRERIKEVLTGTSESIVVRIYGPDLATLRTQAKDIEKRIGDIAGVVDAHASFQTDLPHIEVEPDLDAARSYGLTPGDIRRQASTLIASEEVSDIYSGGRAYDVHVTAIPTRPRQRHRRREPAARHPERQADQAEGRGRGPDGAPRRTRSSATTSPGASTSARTWRSGLWTRSWTTSSNGWRGVSFPLGYHAEVLGESTELDAAEDRLLIFGLAAAAVILLLLQAAFGSFRPGGADVRPVAHGAGWRGHHRMAQRRSALARISGGVPRGVRHRCSQRDLDGQPLPAPGAGGGRAVRP